MYSQHMSYELHPEVRCPNGGDHFNDVLLPFLGKDPIWPHVSMFNWDDITSSCVCVPFRQGQYLAASSLSASWQITWAWVPEGGSFKWSCWWYNKIRYPLYTVYPIIYCMKQRKGYDRSIYIYWWLTHDFYDPPYWRISWNMSLVISSGKHWNADNQACRYWWTFRFQPLMISDSPWNGHKRTARVWSTWLQVFQWLTKSEIHSDLRLLMLNCCLKVLWYKAETEETWVPLDFEMYRKYW